MTSRLYFIQTLSSLHIGTGQGADDIDLPVSRDPVTGHPDIPGSGLKGVLRDELQKQDRSLTDAALGNEDAQGNDAASAVSFGDGRLVCLPVKSLHGTFAWLASPESIRLLGRALDRCGVARPAAIPIVPAGIALTDESALSGDGRSVILNEFSLSTADGLSTTVTNWAEWLGSRLFDEHADRDSFSARFAVVESSVFDFLCEASLPVAARNRIGPNGVVEPGALWYEEFVPAEAVFAGVLTAQNGLGRHNAHNDKALLAHVAGATGERFLQLGGKATAGRGFVRLSFPDRITTQATISPAQP
jgi:CRISPR-associated protein Cmr4